MFQFKEKFNIFEKQVAEDIKLTGDIARKCLSSNEFKTYKKRYAMLEESTVNTLLGLTENYKRGDMTLQEYGAKMFGYMTELKSLRSLLVQIQHDAKKGLTKCNQ